MFNDKRIAVVIPSYKVAKHIEEVVRSLPTFVDHIIVVDDACPQHSGKIIKELGLPKVTVVEHEYNMGVGGAVLTGYQEAFRLQCDVIVKVDGDGQMDPAYVETMIRPIVEEKADYTKGNRFTDFNALKNMPRIRLFGNSLLSFMVKLSSGYWNVMDPTNGFTAIDSESARRLEFKKIAKRYFFESDMLIHLNIMNGVVRDVPIPARYGEEESSLSISKVLFSFPQKLFFGLGKRIFMKYFIYDFNMASVYLLFGLPMFVFGVLFGLYHWYLGVSGNIDTPTGTVMLSVLPIILGVQFLLQAVSIDIQNIPRKEK